MSTAEEYTINVTCDGDGCRRTQVFAGGDKSWAEHEARTAGWKIRSDPAPTERRLGGRLAFCPDCDRAMTGRSAGDQQCTASLGRRGRCPNKATQAFLGTRIYGPGKRTTAVFRRCDQHPLWNATKLELDGT